MKTKTFLSLLFVSFLSFTSFTVTAQDLEKQIDQIVTEVYSANEPGVSVLVAKDGKAIYKKAFGKSNLELDVDLNSNNVFEIGSITKQFTAVSILMLEEQGKLAVDDEITKYIPDYPTNGKTIKIHHLLNHTSGIKSYTSMPNFMKQARIDMTPTELIDVFKNEPMDFDPGEKMLYNNSGYILLGQIIEVVSGQSYEDFIEKNIFEKLGMNSSYYGKMKQVIKNRASGYQQNQGTYSNAEYLSLTLPYAAGSIMSTVDDLLIWQNAISANALIKRSSLEKAINGSILNSGEKIDYGFGWSKGKIQGSPVITHGGGIFGYVTDGIFLPKENMYVVSLSNCDCKSVGAVNRKIAAAAIGRPFPSIKDAVTLSEDKLKKWVGAYEFDKGVIRHVTLKDGKLMSQREGSTNLPIYALSDTHFIFEDGTSSYKFSMTKDGKRKASFSAGSEVIGKEIDKKPPTAPKEIAVSPEVLKEYIGKYELQPGFVIVITAEGSKLFGEPTGQPKVELFAKGKDDFFLKVVVADIVFHRGGNGKVASMTLKQNGREMRGKKIE